MNNSNGGEHNTAHRLMVALSKLREARARMSACPWVSTVYDEVERLTLAVEAAADQHIAACGYAAHVGKDGAWVRVNNGVDK